MRTARGERGIWQRRFWEHLIRDDNDFGRYAESCAINPVKHGFVRRPVDWPYSSFHRDLRRGIHDEDWGTDIDLPVNSASADYRAQQPQAYCAAVRGVPATSAAYG